jgi:hypothetical protein
LVSSALRKQAVDTEKASCGHEKVASDWYERAVEAELEDDVG